MTRAFLLPAAFALSSAAALALAACDSSPSVDVKDATPAEVAEAVKKSGATRVMVRPGKWQSSVAVLEMSNPDMPPEMATRMQAEMGKPRTAEACLTADQVDHPERMIGQIPDSCRYDHYVMSDGKVDGKMRCESRGMIQEMTVAGTYRPDSYQMTMVSRTRPAPGGPPGAEMTMKMRVDSKRIGECDGTEKD